MKIFKYFIIKHDSMRDVSDFIQKVKCLDNTDKLRILELLVRDGERSITDIRKQLRMSFSTAHKFLTDMQKSGMLSSRNVVDGKLKKLYKVEDFNIQLSPETIIDMMRVPDKKETKEFEIKVVGSDGEMTKFSLTDLKKMVVDTGVSFWIADRVIDSLKDKLENNLSISEIRNHVLKRIRDEIGILTQTIHQVTASEIFGSNTIFQMFENRNLKNLLDAHVNCDLHIRNVGPIKPISIQHDFPITLKNGLIFNGKVLATPASRLNVALDHLRVLIEEASNDIISVHGFDHFNVFFAPYIKGLDHASLEQNIREFLYKLKILYETKNIQSYITLDLQVPKFMKKIVAIGPNGKAVGNYSDFEKESQTFLNAFFAAVSEMEKTIEYPKIILKTWNKKTSFDFEKAGNLKNLSCIYFANMIPEWQTENASFMDEVTRLDSTWKGVERTLGTGNLQTVTLNFPRIAYEAKGNDDKLFNILKERTDMAVKILLSTGEIITGRAYSGGFGFLSKGVENRKYFHVDDVMHSVGFGGLNELVKIHTDEEMHESKSALNFAAKILDYTNKILKQTTVRIGLNECLSEWTKRFALNDIVKFGQESVFVKDIQNDPHYTTGANVAEDAKISQQEKLKIEAELQPKISAGHMSSVKRSKDLTLNDLIKTYNGFVKIVI
jgi:ribonucleoside-triphosphate reductase